MRDLLASDYRAPTARDRHADALASLRAMPTAVLLGELAEHRRHTRSRVYWLDGTLGAMRVRRVLRERGERA